MNRLLSYFSFRGRVNRARFWLTGIAIYAIMVVGSVVTVVLDNITPFFAILFLPIFLGAIIASLANGARRLHDRGKSAWWLLLFVLLPALLLAPAEAVSTSRDPSAAAGGLLFALVSLPFSIWGLVVMGFLKGTAGPNRFGEDPLAPTRETLAETLA